MPQLLYALFIIGAAVAAVKVALVLIFLTGIIWRPRTTLSLLVVLGAMALLRNYPRASLALGGVAAVVALARLGDEDPPPNA